MAMIIETVVGAIIGGTTAALISCNKEQEVTPSIVATKAIIGGVTGGVLGVGGATLAGAVSTKAGIVTTISKTATTGVTATPVIQKVAEKLQYSKTALSHLARTNIFRWDVSGTFNGKAGVWELVYDTANNTIYHFLFRGI